MTARRDLTGAERAAVTKLRRVALSWPDTITLASMDGALVVVSTDDQAFHTGEGAERSAGVLATIDGIPNIGGGW